jgi:serralysin
MNPLLHYVEYGWREGRDPSSLFSTGGYRAANPDVASAGIDPLNHFLVWGIHEGRLA